MEMVIIVLEQMEVYLALEMHQVLVERAQLQLKIMELCQPKHHTPTL